MQAKKLTEISALGDRIATQLLKEGVVVQRYDAYSGSVYLKLDYGVCNSIRISDHPGKKHLKYRYNIGPYISGYKEIRDKYIRYYYRADKAKQLIRKILKEREGKIWYYGLARYQKFMAESRRENSGKMGFWRDAVLLNRTHKEE